MLLLLLLLLLVLLLLPLPLPMLLLCCFLLLLPLPLPMLLLCFFLAVRCRKNSVTGARPRTMFSEQNASKPSRNAPATRVARAARVARVARGFAIVPSKAARLPASLCALPASNFLSFHLC